MCRGGLACPGLAGPLTGMVPAAIEKVAKIGRTGANHRLKKRLPIICISLFLVFQSRYFGPDTWPRILRWKGRVVCSAGSCFLCRVLSDKPSQKLRIDCKNT